MSNTKQSQILRAALARLNEGQAWTQGALARNARGFSVFDDDEQAVCWCTLGSVRAEGANNYTASLLNVAANKLGWRKSPLSFKSLVAGYNDAPGRTFAEIRLLFETAIAIAEQKEAA